MKCRPLFVSLLGAVLMIISSADGSSDLDRAVPGGIRVRPIPAVDLATALHDMRPLDADTWTAIARGHATYVDTILDRSAALHDFAVHYPAQFWINYPAIKDAEARHRQLDLEQMMLDAETALVDHIARVAPAHLPGAERLIRGQRRARLAGRGGLSTRRFVDPIRMLARTDPDTATDPALRDALDPMARTLDDILATLPKLIDTQYGAFLAALADHDLATPPYERTAWAEQDRLTAARLWRDGSGDRERRARRVLELADQIAERIAVHLGDDGEPYRRRYFEMSLGQRLRSPHETRTAFERATWLRDLPDETRRTIEAMRIDWTIADDAMWGRAIDDAMRHGVSRWPYHHHFPDGASEAVALRKARGDRARRALDDLLAVLPEAHAEAIRSRRADHPLFDRPPDPPTPKRGAAAVEEWIADLASPPGSRPQRGRLPWPAPPRLIETDWHMIAEHLDRSLDDPELVALRGSYDAQRDAILAAWDAIRKPPSWIAGQHATREEAADLRAGRRMLFHDGRALHWRTVDLIRALADQPSAQLDALCVALRLQPLEGLLSTQTIQRFDREMIIDPVALLVELDLPIPLLRALLANLHDDVDRLVAERSAFTEQIVDAVTDLQALESCMGLGWNKDDHPDAPARRRALRHLRTLVATSDAALRAQLDVILSKAATHLDEPFRTRLSVARRRAAIAQHNRVPLAATIIRAERDRVEPGDRARLDAELRNLDERDALHIDAFLAAVRALEHPFVTRGETKFEHHQLISRLYAQLEQDGERALITLWLLCGAPDPR